MCRLAALTAAVALTLVGCAATDPDVELEDDLDVPASTEQPDGATQAEALPGGGPIPAPGECIDLPPTEELVWTVADAGLVTAGDAEGVLSVDVQPAGGWEYEIQVDDEDEVDVVFRREGEVLRLEVESDDDGIEAELCSDD